MIEILRLNHRIGRDPRVSTHLFLTARAFGAFYGYYSGDSDSGLEESINKIVKKFGGDFGIKHIKNPIKFIKDKKNDGFKIVHLTVYGLPIQEKIEELRKNKNLLIVVGGEKVEPIFYEISDYNISITNQPHSEVSSLCYTLDYYFERKELTNEFKNSEVKIVGKEKGKMVVKEGKVFKEV